MAHKGLILISVPLIFELGFLAIIGSVLSQAQAELDRVTQSRQIVAIAHDAGRILIKLSTLATAITLSPTPKLREHYARLHDELNQEYDALGGLLQDKPAEFEAFASMRVKTEAILSDIEKFQKTQHLSGNIAAILNSTTAKRVGPETDQVGRTLLKLVSAESQTADQGTDKRKELMLRLQLTLFGGLLVNTCITLALGVYFWRNVSKRLQQVMQSATAIAARKPLAEPLGGSDEIAELDYVFHDAAAQLIALENARVRLTSAIAQRLEQPLKAVRGAASDFREGKLGETNERADDRLRRALLSTDRLMRLVDDLKALEKSDRTDMQMLIRDSSLDSIVQSAIASVADFAVKHEVELQVETCPATARVFADPDRLTQVIVNLMSNAIKFSPKRSSVRLAATQSPEGTRISIQDQGIGIAAEHHKKIFEMFEQVDASDAIEKGGSGLGLAICRTIIEKHGGTISVESQKGSGATFIINLAPGQPVEQATEQAEVKVT